MSSDPVLNLAVATGLAILFALAAWHKLSRRAEFQAILSSYRMLPASMLATAKYVVPMLELATALMLMVSSTRELGGFLAAALLSAYGMAMYINIRRGNLHLDCGCSFGRERQQVVMGLVWRNVLLALLAASIFIPNSPRQLAIYDYGTILFAVVAGGLLYQIANTLIAHHKRAQELSL